ncbi:hypothetical protein JTB14_007799 [Gonioctena quinquepunctata]|nr:hypothetical protein JTB14_007799 [Gonioctena quinquepunctata]
MNLVLLYVVLQALQVHSAKILAIIPTASHSHNAPFHPLWRELSLRGHEVTVMTTNPQNNSSLTNLREIDMSYSHRIYKEHNIWRIFADESMGKLQKAEEFGKVCRKVQDAQLSSPEVQELIHNKNITFDLLMIEAQMTFILAFGWRFKCPIIG